MSKKYLVLLLLLFAGAQAGFAQLQKNYIIWDKTFPPL